MNEINKLDEERYKLFLATTKALANALTTTMLGTPLSQLPKKQQEFWQEHFIKPTAEAEFIIDDKDLKK